MSGISGEEEIPKTGRMSREELVQEGLVSRRTGCPGATMMPEATSSNARAIAEQRGDPPIPSAVLGAVLQQLRVSDVLVEPLASTIVREVLAALARFAELLPEDERAGAPLSLLFHI